MPRLSEMPAREVRIIGVPIDLGQHHRGLDMGPSAIRYAKLQARLEGLGYKVVDTGDIPTRAGEATPGANHIPTISQVCDQVYARVSTALASGAIPLVLGGDHSVAIGSVGGATHAGPVGLLWIDAHGDYNTPETSPSGNVHGMPLAVLSGRGAPELLSVGREGAKLAPRDIVILGLRQLDPREKRQLRRSGMSLFTMRDVDERGIGNVVAEALRRLQHVKAIHVSLDMDALDPREAPGVGTPVRGGLSFRESHLVMESISDTGKLSSMDIVEVNPALDTRNRTAELAVDLAISAFGQSIL